MLRIFHIPQADPNPIILAGSPWPIIWILAAYLLFVFKFGKLLMKNRKPFDLKVVLKVYNIMQVIYNGIYFGVVFYYMFIEGICNLRCMESFPQGHTHKQLERVVHAAYLINKVLDLLDTVFFVLRKSFKQVTFLHIYHHVFMAFGSYALTRYYGTGGHLNAVGLLNSLVHTIMYSYYFLSSEYPQVKSNIGWKKYITLTQISQFFLIFSYASYVRFFSPNCGVPRGILYLNMLQGVVFICLFGKFYIQTYLRLPKTPKSKQP
ncbi:elongation of very long chain fatty acids protein F [Drosophila ficusphila]|uniref:elongation of very long chain fatty acids protein F n=1 Tax=Drosophila ficusphila TaxID=30025 RepID=UPI0007E82C0F|nr:elongation of very long chain fatty acids protein F [Drosophila ficusphila]